MSKIDAIITEQVMLRMSSMSTTMKEINSLRLRQRLRKSNATAWTKGCGLAAIQIGIPVRFAWFILHGKEEILLNPEIISVEGPKIFKGEGCLSIPNSYVDTKRFHSIVYVSGGKKKTAHDFKAVLIQHEIDHMNGILNIDKRAEEGV